MLNRLPTARELAQMARYSTKPRSDVANYWKAMDRALVLALQSTVCALEHAENARRIARRLHRADLATRTMTLMVLLGYGTTFEVLT